MLSLENWRRGGDFTDWTLYAIRVRDDRIRRRGIDLQPSVGGTAAMENLYTSGHMHIHISVYRERSDGASSKLIGKSYSGR